MSVPFAFGCVSILVIHLGMAYPAVPDAPKARSALSKAQALNLAATDAAEARKALSALEGS